MSVKTMLNKGQGAGRSDYLEIWKAGVELHKFHDGLKQDRAKRFTNVQIALSGGFGFSLHSISNHQDLNSINIFLFSGGITAVAGLFYSWIFRALDRRAAEYVRIVKNQVREVERHLVDEFRAIAFLPYEGQYRVINRRDCILSKEAIYFKIKNDNEDKKNRRVISLLKDTLKILAPAHIKEQLIIWAVFIGWACALAFLILQGVAASAKADSFDSKRCALIEQEMLSAHPRRLDLPDMFQALGCQPGSKAAIALPAETVEKAAVKPKVSP